MKGVIESYIGPAQFVSARGVRWALFVSLFVVVSVLAPYAVHTFGISGRVFLPMHFCVMLASLVMGLYGGLVTAVLSPIVSYSISGMPPYASLFPMTCELMTYALCVWLFSARFRLPASAALAVSMILGRVVSVSITAMVSDIPLRSLILGVTVVALPGIILQLVFLPPLAGRISKFLEGSHE
jgi:hypothetical protein